MDGLVVVRWCVKLIDDGVCVGAVPFVLCGVALVVVVAPPVRQAAYLPNLASGTT